jgi:hypothetical protein
VLKVCELKIPQAKDDNSFERRDSRWIKGLVSCVGKRRKKWPEQMIVVLDEEAAKEEEEEEGRD